MLAVGAEGGLSEERLDFSMLDAAVANPAGHS